MASDLFFAMFNNSGKIEWASYYGGAGTEDIVSITVNPANCDMYFCGDGGGLTYTAANYTTFPSVNPGGGVWFQNQPGLYVDYPIVGRFTSALVNCQPQITATATGNNITCNGKVNGVAVATVSGGASPFTYVWNPGGKTTQIITGLYAGTYTVIITDALSASATATVTITEPPMLAIALTSTSLSCNGFNTGMAAVIASGGTVPYTYNWSNGANASVILNLISQIYSVTVTDGNGCSTAASVFINQPSVITVSISVSTTACLSSVGSVTITASGGTGGYTYLWSNGSIIPVLTGLSAANYQFTVTDANLCTQTGNVQVSNFPGANAAIVSTASISCYGICNAGLSAGSNGGTVPYYYKWSNGASTADITGLCSGIYCATVTDGNGCSSSTVFTIMEPNLLTITLTATDATCNQSNGTANVTANGGTGSYVYYWSNSESTSQISNLSSQIYSVVVTDNNGCFVNATVSVTGSNSPSAGITIVQEISCYMGMNGILTVTITGGTQPYNILWSNASNQVSISNLPSGIYTLTLTDNAGCIITSAVTLTEPSLLTVSLSAVSGCSITNPSASAIANGGLGIYSYVWSNGESTSQISNLSSQIYSVTVSDANNCTATGTVSIFGSTLSAAASGNITINKGDSTQLNASGGGLYHWFPPTGLSCDTCSNPIAFPDITTTFCIEITDANGCTDTACVTVTVEFPCSEIFVPSAFSPNGDDENEELCIYGINCVKSIKFAIYNRWGEKVFETTDPGQCWDGNYKDKPEYTAIFVYKMEVVLKNRYRVTKQGNISLIR